MLSWLSHWLGYVKLFVATIAYREISDIYKGMIKNPRWFVMRKLSRFRTGRFFVQWWRKKRRAVNDNSHRNVICSSIFSGIDIEETVHVLKSDGVCVGLNLPDHIVNEVVEFAYKIPCYANGRLNLGFYYKEKEKVVQENQLKLIIGDYYNTSSCAAIQKIIHDPIILEISRQYFDGPPVCQGHKLWWSFPTELDLYTQFKYGQTFHYDVDDYVALKFFFYLTDVRGQSGPHMCVLGSHHNKPFLNRVFAGYWSDNRIIKKYGEKSIKIIYGNSGSGFIEDVACFHKGLPPQCDDRLILVIEYTLKDYGMQNNCRSETQLKMMA